MNIRAIIFSIISLLLTQLCIAQTCKGSLGDPIVKIDFGSGVPNIGAPLAPGITNYTYVTGQPNDGEYTIAKSTNGIAFPSWFVTTDHTGNPDGYMMVVNASYKSTDVFYKQTITGLCPGTTYEFAVWVLNLNNKAVLPSNPTRSLPNLTFSVENIAGTALVTPYNTGNVTETLTPTWVQYALTFTTPPTENSVIIKINNNATGGEGNDLLLDDITFRPCGPSIVAGFGKNTALSYGNCLANPQKDTLTATASVGYTNPAYQWQLYDNASSTWTNILGKTATTYIFDPPTTAGTYLYRMTSGEATNIGLSNCFIASKPITLTVTQNPTATAGSSSATVCKGSTLTLNATGGISYVWKDPNGVTFSTLQNPVINNITVAQAGTYTVTTYLGGCSSQASVNVAVQPKITANVSPDLTICQGTTTQLIASGGTSYTWSPATGLSNPTIANPIASPTDTTKYTVTVTNNTCSSTASVTVNVTKKPVMSAGGNKTVISGQSVRLTGTAKGSGVLTYAWTPTTNLSDPTSLTPLATPTVNTTYTLHVTEALCGTTITDTSRVTVYTKVEVPNVFSPNNDSVNDKWEISGLAAYPESVLCVYTRNGQMIYTTIGYSKAWDGTYNGKLLPEGTYYYTIDLKNGTPIQSGSITILR
jgi:gliding motility-associated-like protein